MFGTSHAQTSAGAAYLSRPGGQQQRWRREQPRERCRGNAAAARQQGLQSKASSLEIASRLCRLPGKLLQHLQQQRTGLEDVRPAVARAAGRPCAWAAWPAPVLYSKATQQSCQRRQQPGIASSSAASAVTRAAAGPFWAHRAARHRRKCSGGGRALHVPFCSDEAVFRPAALGLTTGGAHCHDSHHVCEFTPGVERMPDGPALTGPPGPPLRLQRGRAVC